MRTYILRYKPVAGEAISKTAEIIVEIAKQKDCLVGTTFNGILIFADKNSNAIDIVNNYTEEGKTSDNKKSFLQFSIKEEKLWNFEAMRRCAAEILWHVWVHADEFEVFEIKKDNKSCKNILWKEATQEQWDTIEELEKELELKVIYGEKYAFVHGSRYTFDMIDDLIKFLEMAKDFKKLFDFSRLHRQLKQE